MTIEVNTEIPIKAFLVAVKLSSASPISLICLLTLLIEIELKMRITPAKMIENILVEIRFFETVDFGILFKDNKKIEIKESDNIIKWIINNLQKKLMIHR
jgi:hypothetical protein